MLVSEAEEFKYLEDAHKYEKDKWEMTARLDTVMVWCGEERAVCESVLTLT